MSELDVAFHKRWLGMLEPIEGLVVSIPVLVEAECLEKRDAELSRQLADDAAALTRSLGKTASGQSRREIISLDDFLSRVLGLAPELFARESELPADLELYVPEGGETIRPTLALKRRGATGPSQTVAAGDGKEGVPDVSTAQSRAGEGFAMLVWDLPGVALDEVDRREGHWAYPPAAKFDRLLRACRVPIGLLSNREELRLVYAPHGESSGALTFRVGDLAAVGGRDILDAFVMLLSKQRFFGVAKDRQLPALLQKSRAHQANVTTELADQVFDALGLLLRGFERAAERDGGALLFSTGTTGAEGTLGGLIEQGRSLAAHLARAFDQGVLCSNDPVCAAHDPGKDPTERFLEGAACHGCLFIAEPSCEHQNRFLDRALVVPTLGHEGAAFFRERP
ncbi:MAG: hypothetical protein ABI895_27925 [Deltaproteobacteria bacterium]